MGKDEYVIVVFKSENGEEVRRKVKKGERIMLKNKKFVVAGVSNEQETGPNVRFEEVPKTTIKSLLLKKKSK